MAKNSNLLDSLRNRLAEPAAPAPTPIVPDGPTTGTIRATAPAEGTNKLSISLYPVDLVRLDEIKAYMRSRGVRKVTDSEAIRLAIRSAPLGDELDLQYKRMQCEDLRRKIKPVSS
jgi:hypothetical protein